MQVIYCTVVVFVLPSYAMITERDHDLGRLIE